jgi:dTDP-4-amino-4,6-dideoxygalactose transaminase
MSQDGVPLLDLRAQYATIRAEVERAIREVVESQGFVGGPQVEALEQEIATLCGTRHAVGCGSGSDALLLALMALGVGPGDEVLCPSFSFFATAGSTARLGARPVFCDLDPVTYNLDPVAARKAAEGCSQLRAIMPVHLFGQVAPLDAVLDLAQEQDVPVVEDAAQAIGARGAQDRAAGSRGRLSCFSFYPTKNLGGFGNGGIVTTDDPDLAAQLVSLRNHGEETRYHHRVVGINSRLDSIQAAVLRVKLRHLDAWTDARRSHAAFYDAAFAAAGAADSAVPLSEGGLPLRTPRPPAPPARHIYNQYVIRVPAERRDPLRSALADQGIGTAIYYPLGLHQQECFADLGYAQGDLPETEAAAHETLALPVYPELTNPQLERVVDAITRILR